MPARGSRTKLIRKKQSKPEVYISKKRIVVRFVILFFVVVAAGLLIFIHLQFNQQLMRQPTPLSDEKYYFTDSRYSEIRSKFVIRQTSREKVSIEYPITKNNKINKTIAGYDEASHFISSCGQFYCYRRRRGIISAKLIESWKDYDVGR